MKNVQKRNRLNSMNPAARASKLGNLIPFVVSVTTSNEDVSAGKARIDTGLNFQIVSSVCVVGTDGTLRPAAKVNKEGTVLEVEAVLELGDTVTVAVI